MASCTWHETRRALTLAESIISEQPDSALFVLDQINPDNLKTKRQSAKYALLLSMALDKNYIDVTDDSLISIAYNYYQRHPGKQEKMLSTYYSGIVKENAGNYLSAAVDFDQTLSLANRLNDNHNCGLACRHLSDIYYRNYNHIKALEYSQKAVVYFDACGETLSADYARTNVALQLSSILQWDKTICIIDDVLSRADFQPLIHNALVIKSDALIWGKEDYKGAMECLDKIAIGNSYVDSMIYFGNKGYVCEALGKSTESKDYFKIAQSFIRDAGDSLTVFDQMSRAFRMRGDYKNAYSYLKIATDLQNKQVTDILGQSVSVAFEEYYRDSLKNQKEKELLNNIIYAILAVLLLLIIVTLSNITRKLHFDKIQDIASIESLTNDLQVLQERNQHFRQTSNAVIIDKVRFLQQLSDSYFSWTDEEVRKREKQKGVQTKDEIISVFRKQLGEMRADKSLISSLEEAVNASNDNIVQRLRQEYKDNLKEQDFIIITMLFSGLSIKSIAYLLRMSEPSLRTRKSRYKSLFQDQPAPSSQDFIRMLG